jgi:hypothetical protein
MKQKTLKLKFSRVYKNAQSKQVFVYFVSGSEEALEAYIDYQGDMLRYEDNDESKRPLFFTTKYANDNAVLSESTSENGGWYIDRTEEDKLMSMLDQYGDSPLGRALAAELAKEKLAALRKGVSARPAATTKTEPVATDQDLGEL